MLRSVNKEIDPKWVKLVDAQRGTQLAREDTHTKRRRQLQHLNYLYPGFKMLIMSRYR